MKNLRKKRYLFFLIGLGIILWISTNWFMKSEAEKMVISCSKIYRHTMKLEYVIVDEDKKSITVEFKMKDGYMPRTQDDIAETYQAVIRMFFSDSIQYKNYLINIHFVHIDEVITIFNITNSLDSIKFASNRYISIKDIAELFPYISKLYLYPAFYNDITEISFFSDLKYVYFSQGLTPDEKDYILSLYPNCEIDEYGDLQEV